MGTTFSVEIRGECAAKRHAVSAARAYAVQVRGVPPARLYVLYTSLATSWCRFHALGLTGCCGIDARRTLLDSGRQLQTDEDAGRTLYNAIRSGAVDSYPGVKRDWQREQQFRNRLVDMRALRELTHQPAYVTLLRSGFEQPADASSIDQRVDAGATRGHSVGIAIVSDADVFGSE
jgi:hypothetical protein